MAILTLYHGTSEKNVHPAWGLGNDKQDYGRGFYLTDNMDLAKEWAVCRPNKVNGWLHGYELETEGLCILDFQKVGVLAWLAELMKHKDVDTSRRYRMHAAKFIEQYAIDAGEYDIIRGWRADASYFCVAKEFVRDNIDVDILDKLLRLGNPGIQYCIKSKRAFLQLNESQSKLEEVSYDVFNRLYNIRDTSARKAMYDLIDSDENKVTHIFSRLFDGNWPCQLMTKSI